MTELGVYIGNASADYAQFKDWLGEDADAVLAYTGSGSFQDANPGWQIGMPEFLGGTGVDKHWSIPMFPDLGSQGANVASMREVAAGQHQSEFTDWARQILASDSGDDPIYVRTTWELGGEWFYWTGAAQEDPEAYKQAFQQFAEAFHDVSDRFEIVWDIVPDRGPQEQFYPGDEAVDVIGQDVYWAPQWQGADADAAFEQKVDEERGLAWVADFAAEHGKQIAIPEFGVPGANEDNPYDSAQYLRNMEEWVESHDVAFVDYWNADVAYSPAGTGPGATLSDGEPAEAAAELKRLYTEGLGAGGPPPPTLPPDTGEDEEPMATFEFGTDGPDELRLFFTQDKYGEDARVNFGVLNGNEYSGNAGEWIPVSAVRGSEPDVMVIRGDFVADSSFFFSFVNDAWGGTPDTDRNVQLVKAEINGVEIPDAAAELFSSGDAGPFYFDGDAQGSDEEEPGMLVTGTAGPDTLAGGTGDDTIDGLGGDDVLDGLAGDDVLDSGPGSDVITGGLGDDTVTTSGGRDAIRFAPRDGKDVVTDFVAGTDAVWIGSGAGDVTETEITRDGVTGTLISFTSSPADEVWLPGATGLGPITVIA